MQGSNRGLSFANVVNNDGGNIVASVNGNTQSSRGHASHNGATETLCCCYFINEEKIKPKCLKIKAKQGAEEVKNPASGGTSKTDYIKYSDAKNSHMILVN